MPFEPLTARSDCFTQTPGRAAQVRMDLEQSQSLPAATLSRYSMETFTMTKFLKHPRRFLTQAFMVTTSLILTAQIGWNYCLDKLETSTLPRVANRIYSELEVPLKLEEYVTVESRLHRLALPDNIQRVTLTDQEGRLVAERQNARSISDLCIFSLEKEIRLNAGFPTRQNYFLAIRWNLCSFLTSPS